MVSRQPHALRRFVARGVVVLAALCASFACGIKAAPRPPRDVVSHEPALVIPDAGCCRVLP